MAQSRARRRNVFRGNAVAVVQGGAEVAEEIVFEVDDEIGGSTQPVRRRTEPRP